MGWVWVWELGIKQLEGHTEKYASETSLASPGLSSLENQALSSTSGVCFPPCKISTLGGSRQEGHLA